MCIRLVIIYILHVSAEQMMQSKDHGGVHSRIREWCPDKAPASRSMITQLAQITAQRPPEEGRECLWLCPLGLTIQGRGCAVSGYRTTCVVIY